MGITYSGADNGLRKLLIPRKNDIQQPELDNMLSIEQWANNITPVTSLIAGDGISVTDEGSGSWEIATSGGSYGFASFRVDIPLTYLGEGNRYYSAKFGTPTSYVTSPSGMSDCIVLSTDDRTISVNSSYTEFSYYLFNITIHTFWQLTFSSLTDGFSIQTVLEVKSFRDFDTNYDSDVLNQNQFISPDSNGTCLTYGMYTFPISISATLDDTEIIYFDNDESSDFRIVLLNDGPTIPAPGTLWAFADINVIGFN